jgi:hypothetical protein
MMIRSQRNRALIGKQPEVGEKKFKMVEEFPYLGVLVNDKFETSLEIKRRLVSAQRAFYSVNHMLSSRKITRSTKFAIYNTVIRPTMVYSAESWNSMTNDEERPVVFERKVLRMIGPLKVSEGVNRQRSNHNLYQVYQHPDIVTVAMR